MIKKITRVILLFTIILLFSACDSKSKIELANPRNDIYYQIFVRSFADSDNDGVGDFKGIIQKIDYLKELGITGIWLMPIHPSPTYHGYDVIDYYAVNPDYGTMEDFENLLKEAKKRNINVMLDMVFNHTSNQHLWFQEALAGNSEYRDYYIFSDSTTNRGLTGSWGQFMWHFQNNQYYCGNFGHTMPDLNYTNENVQKEIFNISEYWIKKGVGGFRLDAANLYYGLNEYQDKSSEYYFYENLIFHQKLRRYCRELNPEFYLIGEIFEKAETLISKFYKGLDSPLDFPISERIVQTVLSNGSSTYANYLEKIYNTYRDENLDFISAPFLRNHDQDRIASYLNGDAAKIKLSVEMLLTLPGTPIIYYGDEVGMFGVKSNGEKSNGIDIWDETRRLPIPFGDQYQTTWFNDQSFPSVKDNQNVETISEQMNDEKSIWKTYQMMIKVRNGNIALKYGNTFEQYENNNSKIQGFYREFEYQKEKQKILVIHNLSTEDVPMPNLEGKIIYMSGESANLDVLRAKSTIIIDVTENQK